VLWHWRALLTFSLPPTCLLAVVTFCSFVQVAFTTLLQHGYKWYTALCRSYCTTLCATSSYTLDISLACSITHHIFIFVNSLSVLKFPLSGKLLQTVKLLTCVRGASSSWTTAFQPKDSKLHTECKSYDRLWRVQYCVYGSYCCCSNLYTRMTEQDTNQPHWMKDISWLHQEWFVQ
jgi:hypothetical protein